MREMIAERTEVELLEKNKPRQERAKRTYEAILLASAELLVEVGVERISTNIMAERAGITVPALYRYFPNKYAVLFALGASLMDRQNEVFRDWYEVNTVPGDPATLMDGLEALLRDTCKVTREQVGGIQILQALRAVAPLQEVRLQSHRIMAEELHTVVTELYDLTPNPRSALQTRLTVELGYSVVEMVLEDPMIDEGEAMAEGAGLLRHYWEGILSRR